MIHYTETLANFLSFIEKLGLNIDSTHEDGKVECTSVPCEIVKKWQAYSLRIVGKL